MTGQPAAVAAATRALAAAEQDDMVWGHVGLRDADGRGVWMKAAGWGFEEVGPDRVLLVGWDGSVLHGSGRRHIEYHIHTAVLRRRPDVEWTVHTHSAPVNAFASLGVPLRAISHAGVLFADPQVPRFAGTGDLIDSEERGAGLAEALGGGIACLMPRHGLLAVGTDAAEAVMHAVLLDRACSTALLAEAAGGPRDWSDAAEVAEKSAKVWSSTQIQAGYAYLERRGARMARDAP